MDVSGIPLEIWIIILEMKFKMEKWDMIRYMETLGLNLVKDYCFNGEMAYTMIFLDVHICMNIYLPNLGTTLILYEIENWIGGIFLKPSFVVVC
jgi:hypothetical protein